ncbi:MAG: hypothetical protein ABR523_07805 [Desulfurivibrionaceae bacterium]
MSEPKNSIESLFSEFVIADNHRDSNYFTLLRKLVLGRNSTTAGDDYQLWQEGIDKAYSLLDDEIRTNEDKPITAVKFGTSGWRGLLGKDLFVKSVVQVTMAICELYDDSAPAELRQALGVKSRQDAQKRGGIIGFDNRFGGELLAGCVAEVLSGAGFGVHYAGESSTGVLSAALLELNAAFSINLTPSHNPLEYGGF